MKLNNQQINALSNKILRELGNEALNLDIQKRLNKIYKNYKNSKDYDVLTLYKVHPIPDNIIAIYDRDLLNIICRDHSYNKPDLIVYNFGTFGKYRLIQQWNLNHIKEAIILLSIEVVNIDTLIQSVIKYLKE